MAFREKAGVSTYGTFWIPRQTRPTMSFGQAAWRAGRLRRAGMTLQDFVTRAEAGVQIRVLFWIPTYVGMTLMYFVSGSQSR